MTTHSDVLTGADLPSAAPAITVDTPDKRLPFPTASVTAIIARLVCSGGPRPDQYQWLTRLVTMIWEHVQSGRVGEQDLKAIRAAFGPVLSPATLAGRALAKRFGCPGDFEILDAIYREERTTEPTLIRWDEYVHAQPATQAVRNRKAYFKALLRHTEAKSPTATSTRILNVASGPARDLREYFEEHPSSRTSVLCVDFNPHAIAFGRTLCDPFRDRVEFVCADIRRLRSLGRFELVWSAGLFDYFDDRAFVRLLTRLAGFVAPGGTLVIGNFSPKNSTRAYMEICSEWFLQHRSGAELERLGRAVCSENGFDVHVEAEPSGVNLFLHLTRA